MKIANRLLILCLLCLTPCSVSATVGGDCDVCHNLYPGMMEKTYTGKAFQYVLKNDFCVKCHSNTNSDTIKILGGNRVPVVHTTVPPVNALAGGNFYYAAKDFGDRKGHNVDGISSTDMKFRNEPPGYSRRSDPSYTGYSPQKTLMCAGSNGCHGDRNIEDPFAAVMGAHHALDKPVDGSTIAKSYRFLRNTSSMKGVTGNEDKNWNQKASSANHNEYSTTIDLVCTGCHGDYHNTERKTGAWFRHPVGAPLPAKGDYANYTTYSPDAPVAREVLPAASLSGINHGRDSVMCLSCHVAHASPYDSMLRWDYEKLYTENKGGCNICHYGK